MLAYVHGTKAWAFVRYRVFEKTGTYELKFIIHTILHVTRSLYPERIPTGAGLLGRPALRKVFTIKQVAASDR